MANESGRIERVPLPPPNSPTIGPADRSAVYSLIGEQLNSILNGVGAYDPDGVKKSAWTLLSELKDFVGGVVALRNAVNDPSDILGDAARDLGGFAKTFEKAIGNDVERLWNDPSDKRDQAIKIPDTIAPTTWDHNVIDVGPNPDGTFSVPNPLAPKRALDRRASAGSSENVLGGVANSGEVRRLGRRVVSSTPEGFDRGASGSPRDKPDAIGGLAGRFAALAGIYPPNPNQFAPPPDDGSGGFASDDPTLPWLFRGLRLI